MNSNGHRKILGRDVQPEALNRITQIDIPNSEISVLVREVTIGELEALPTDPFEQLALLIVDEQGNLLYSNPDGIERLRKMGMMIALYLIEEAAKVNGLSRAAAEQTLKNSEASPSAASVGV